MVWNKAQHSLGPSKLKDLKNDLTKHELDELNLKKMKAHNQDKDGLFEAAVRKKLLSILAKYSLDRYYDDIHSPVATEPEYKRGNLDKRNLQDSKPVSELKANFRDKRLDKLWKKAEQSGFTQDELMLLHEEFEHHQEKLDEHYDTMNRIEQELDERDKDSVNHDNSIEGNLNMEPKRRSDQKKNKESPREKRARLESNVQQALKEKYSDIKKDIGKLQKKIADRKIIAKNGPFEEEPVNELWSAAIKANFNEEELKSIKEELRHYEVRIKKLKHFQNQLERNSIGYKDSSSNGETIDDETKHIINRVDELTNNVEKTHKSLEKKISHTARGEL